MERESRRWERKYKAVNNWTKTIEVHFKQCESARRRSAWLHRNAAIRKGALQAGKIVVVPPKH